MTKNKLSYAFLGLLIVAMLVVLITAATWRSTEAKTLPILFGGLVLALAILQLTREVLAQRKARRMSAGPEEMAESPETLRRIGVAVGWTLGFLLLVYMVGITLSIPIFTVAYLKSRKRGWLISGAYALALTALIYGGFQLGLKLQLYPGLLFSL